MGIIKCGILGGFRNKTGAVVGVRWRSLDVMRSMPRKTNKAFSPTQLDQQKKFKLLSQLLSKVSSLINIGFAAHLGTATAMNRAMAYNLQHALVGIAPALDLDYQNLSFSRGPRALPKTVTVEGWTQTRLVFSWDYAGDRNKREHGRDLVTVIVYCPATQRVVNLMRIASRADRIYTMKLPSNFGGNNLHAYLLFESAEAKTSVSNSMYLGEVQVLR